jgi:hypothetical protein
LADWSVDDLRSRTDIRVLADSNQMQEVNLRQALRR